MRVLSVLVQLACYVHFSLAMKTSCMVPPVRLGDEATLSCHFEADISKVQHDVLVYLYKGDHTEHPVLIYAWHDGQAKIQAMDGYRCEGNIFDYLVIKILNVSESNAGQYSCLVATLKDQSMPCTLKIIELNLDSSVVAVGKDPTLQDAHSSIKMSSFVATEHYAIQAHNIYDEHNEGDKNKFYIATMVLGVVLIVVVVIFITILIIAIYKRWIHRRCCTQSVLNSDDSINSNIKSKKDSYEKSSVGKTNIKRDKDQQVLLV